MAYNGSMTNSPLESDVEATEDIDPAQANEDLERDPEDVPNREQPPDEPPSDS